MCKKILFSTLLACAAIIASAAPGDPPVSVKDVIGILHDRLGLLFIYDSSLDLSMTYPAQFKLPDDGAVRDQEGLERYVRKVFRCIEYDVMIEGKYVVLSDKKDRTDAFLVHDSATVNDTITESSVIAVLDRNRNSTQTGLVKVSGLSMRDGFMFMSQPDIIKNLQVLPGVSGGTEGMSGFYVHGGDGKDNLFLLDGVEVYSVTHLGGIFSSFNVDVTDYLDFYKSGFPARFGGKTSSVVDIKTKEGNPYEHHGIFSIGLVDGSFQIDGPVIKGKTTYNVGLRRSWLDLITAPAFAIYNARSKSRENINMRYALTDFNFGITHRFTPGNRLGFNVYLGSDVLKNRNQSPGIEFWEGKKYTGENRSVMDIGWGNILASLAWTNEVSEKFNYRISGYYTHSYSMIMNDSVQWQFIHEEEGNGNYTSEDNRKEDNRSGIHDVGLKSDFNYIPHRGNHLRFGSDFKAHIYRSSRTLDYSREFSTGKKEIFAEGSGHSKNRSGDISFYLEDELTYLKWLKANVGLRYALFFVRGKVHHRVEPRAAIKFQFCPELSFKASYTEMNQFTHKMSSVTNDLPSMCFLPSTAEVPPVHSKQVAGGFYSDLPYGLHFSIEGFYRTMDNLTEYKGKTIVFPSVEEWNRLFARGRGRAYGMEAEATWKTYRTQVSIYYTLSWNERRFEDFHYDWYPDVHDNRHKVSIVATHRFSKKFDMYLAWHYHTGNNTTTESHSLQEKDGTSKELVYSTPNNFKLPDYHRLDVGMNFRKRTRKGNESVWNLSLYNAYNRINTLWVTLDRKEQSEEVIAKAFGVIPIFPTFSYTYRF